MRCLLLSFVTIALVACNKKDDKPAPRPTGPVEVGVVTIQPRSVTLTKELPGRVSAYRVAEVRARVNGIVQKRLFEEGSDVKANQPLFKIDAAPYQATLESMQAQIAKADAMVAQTRSLAERYAKLIESNAVSKQEYEDAVAKVKTAQADLAAARAAVKSAAINVGYTTVTAPLAGRIGRAEVTEGAYVQAQTATLLATIQQLDRVYVDLTWSNTEAMRLRRAVESGQVQSEGGQAKVVLVLEDGREYGLPGTLQFADVTVDPTTGSISLRALVPNPSRELLPGMFVRARIDEGVQPNAILVPQRAVTRDQGGNPTTLVVTPAKKVERRQLVADRAIGDAWLVTSGLSAGEQVIVEGLQKARPGADVIPVPAKGTTTQAAATGSGSGSGSGPPAAGSAQPMAGSAQPRAGSGSATGSGVPR
ncbi:MAG: efflux RND transporter periplasmic adaptor subunit [Deltaproteobacteria bacterium]|nr:efflux RND transporter periplasmic adaptor subunit [Deltaproteobacteria bacterium]